MTLRCRKKGILRYSAKTWNYSALCTVCPYLLAEHILDYDIFPGRTAPPSQNEIFSWF